MNDLTFGIDPGSKVKLHFSISLRDGTMVESSHGEEPLQIVVGEGQLEWGLEQCLYGLRVGQKKRFEISPAQGFGFSDPAAVQLLSREEFPQGISLERGVIVEFTTPGEDEIPGTILTVGDESVEVDFNHPLAGRDLVFEVEILEVSCPA